jgi:hypothetical protein
MVNNEFRDELSRKSNYIYGKNASKKIFEELDSLDPRESNLVYRVFRYDPTSVEYSHTKTRLSALVSAGTVSKDLLELATNANEANFDDTKMDGYTSSRLDLVTKLDLYSINSGESNLLDPTGELEYRINSGYSKENIMSYLESSSAFKGISEARDESVDESDIEAKLAKFKLNEFMDALDNLQDPEEPVDFKEIAKEKIKKYDPSDRLADMIDSGAGSQEILEVLDDNPFWNEDAEDYLTKAFVDNPRYSQIENWNNFLSVLNSIKDLDNN